MISTLLTSLLISLIASVWIWVMGRRDPAGQPWLTGLCLTVLMILPVLAQLPKWQVEWQASLNSTQKLQESGLGYWQEISSTMLWVWLIGGTLMLLRWMVSQAHLKKWITDSEEVTGVTKQEWRQCLNECGSMLGVKTLPTLRVKSGLSSPVVAGVWNPVILMPMGALTWKNTTVRMAILHELGHIKRKDLWLRAAADLACAIHWYNPLIRWMRTQLLTQCEYACDAQVVHSGADHREYITALCDVLESAQRENRPLGTLSMADHAPLKARVSRLITPRRFKHSWLALMAAAFTLSTALGLTLVRPKANQNRNDSPTSESLKREINLRHTANPFPEK